MKRIYIFSFLYFLLPLSILADKTSKSTIRYSLQNTIKSVEFSNSDKTLSTPKSATEFFTSILKKRTSDEFRINSAIKLDKGNETFCQYYRGILVDGAGYAFHYDNEGNMYYAHGNYEHISDLDITHN